MNTITTNRRSLSTTVDILLGLSMLLLFAAAVASVFLLRGVGLWPPRASESSLHSGVQ
jgi:hypothetical protein